MANQEKEYYYVGGKKVKVQRLPDSFAARYKPEISSQDMVKRLAAKEDFGDAEERKELPRHRMVVVTLPHSRRLADTESSIKELEGDEDIEFIAPVFREPRSGLRLIPTDEITVRFKNTVSQSDIEAFNKENEVEVIEKNRYVTNQFILRVKSPNDTLLLANKYQESDLTEFAEPNFVAEARKGVLPNDEYLGEQWHLQNTGQGGGLPGEDVGAMEAWGITAGSPNITIAIIDDGVDIDHPDLHENIWENPDSSAPDRHGWNFYDDTDDPRPRKFAPPYDELAGNDSHGTPCAGVAAAVGANATGVAGIAYRCKILPVKIFLADDLVPFSVLADAIRYAGQRADVLSNSWGIPPSSNVAQAIRDVVQTGRGGKGTPVFVATGNGYQSSIGFPASVPEAIAVGASTNRGQRSSYSNYGEGIDFVAPSNGGTRGIFATDVSIPGRGFNVGNINSGDADGLYTNSFGGTSSATPLAAGIAALILSLNKDLRWDQVRNYMRSTADKIDQVNGNYVNGYSLEYGYGRVNAFNALEAVQDDDEDDIIEKAVNPAKSIPDHNLQGITSAINIDEEGTIRSIEHVNVDISHTYRGDLVLSLRTPWDGVIALHQGQGGGADNLVETYTASTTPALQQIEGKSVRGTWLLQVVDRWPRDDGTLNSWGLKFKISSHIVRESVSPGLHIPDDDPAGITSTLNISKSGEIQAAKVAVDISHTYIGDLTVAVTSPSNTTVVLHNKTGGNADNLQAEYTTSSHPQLGNLLGEEVFGEWKLVVADHYGFDLGKLNRWEIELRV